MENIILVSIICLSYNQAGFVADALASVFWQTYPNIELIVVDDGSTDGSKTIIKNILKNSLNQHPDAFFIDLAQNIGNCKAFNIALNYAKGDYIIDLAADDILLANCVKSQVASLIANPNAGLCFADAWLYDFSAKMIKRYHGQPQFQNKDIAQGYVFENLFLGQFICPPTVMFDAARLRQIGGYDPELSYEDFDVWMRLARNYPFVYINQTLVIKRILPGSLSKLTTRTRKKAILGSTLIICKKALALAANTSETNAIIRFMRWHLHLCVRLGERNQAGAFAKTILPIRKLRILDKLAISYLGRIWPLANWLHNKLSALKNKNR